MQPSLRHHGTRLGLVALWLMVLTACLEHFEALVTHVDYDVGNQRFVIERRLVGIDAAFLDCDQVASCVAAIERAVARAPDGNVALSDRLLQRLLDGGATGLGLELIAEGDRLDVVVRYHAPVGTSAANDTMVRAEWSGKNGKGRYNLIIEAQDTITPPKRYTSRKRAHVGPSGLEWIEDWVLPRRYRKVDTEMRVAAGGDLFAEVPGLLEALQSRGLLGPQDLLGEDTGAPIPLVDSGRGSPVVDTGARSTDSGVDGTPSAQAPIRSDPPAKTYVYEAQVTGDLSSGLVDQAVAPLVPRITRCYEVRQAAVADLGGDVFLSALVGGDGRIVSTSVYGSVEDPDLLRCLESVVDQWRFEPWGTPDAVSDIAVPIVFRVEDTPVERRQRQR